MTRGSGSDPLVLSYERSALLDATQVLVHEFGHLPAGYVIACVLRCRDSLERTGVRAGLATTTTAMARARLAGTGRELAVS